MYITHSQGDPTPVYERANSAQRHQGTRASGSGHMLERFAAHRRLGPREVGVAHMLDALGYQSLDELTTAAMPENIAQQDPLVLPDALTETQAQTRLRELAAKNTVKKSMIGQGFYDTITPAVI